MEEGYTSISSGFKWNGNYEGCECMENNKPKTYILYSCKATCTKIPSSTATQLSLWRGQNICAKRSTKKYEDFSVLSKKQVLAGIKCPSKGGKDMKPCGAIDTIDNILCVGVDENCPINVIKFIDQNDIISYLANNFQIPIDFKEGYYLSILKDSINKNIIFNKLASFGTIEKLIDSSLIDLTLTTKLANFPTTDKCDFATFNDNYYLLLCSNPIDIPKYITTYKNNNSTNIKFDEVINVIFQISLNSLPCEEIFQKPSTDKFSNLVIDSFDFTCDLKEQNNTKSEMFDTRYKVLDSYLLSKFFKDNNFYTTFQKVYGKTSISLNSTNANSKVKIFSRPYSGHAVNCEVTVDPYSVGNIGGLHEFLSTHTQINSMVLYIIVHSIGMIGSLLGLAASAFMLQEYYEWIYKLLNLAFCVINLILPVQIISNSNHLINVLTTNDGDYCGDDITNELFKSISSSCLDVKYNYFVILILCILNSLVFIYTIYKLIKPYNQQFQDQFNKYVEMKEQK